MSEIVHQSQPSNQSPVTIAVGASQSSAVNTEGSRGAAVDMPSTTYDQWTAAAIGIEVSNDGGDTWQPLRGADGNKIKVTVGAAGVFVFGGEAWAIGAFTQMRLASINGSTGALVNQTSGTTRTLNVALLR